MIFVSVGTQKFQFNRLLEYIDLLIEKNIITNDVFAQIGYSTYIPKHYEYTFFLNHVDFQNMLRNCDFFITHSGVGSLLEGLRLNKQIIVCPRQKKFKEHVDNHQNEIFKKFLENNYIFNGKTYENIKESIEKIEQNEIKNKISFIDSINNVEYEIIKFLESEK